MIRVAYATTASWISLPWRHIVPISSAASALGSRISVPMVSTASPAGRRVGSGRLITHLICVCLKPRVNGPPV